ncbi:MAG: hypothetical protein LAT76_12865, partial [Schleiferiaceae bacterium]|nr:hypothetical protein [Schleiferiaceae bacterium]
VNDAVQPKFPFGQITQGIQLQRPADEVFIDTSWFGVSTQLVGVTLWMDSLLEVTETMEIDYVLYFQSVPRDTLKLRLLPPHKEKYTYEEYNSNNQLKLYRVHAVTAFGNVFEISGVHKMSGDVPLKRFVLLSGNKDYFYHTDAFRFHWFETSFLFAPIRFRPTQGIEGPTSTLVNFSSLLLNLDFLGMKSQRYYRSGEVSNYKFAFGLFGGPTVHSVFVADDEDDRNVLSFSCGLSVTYAINHVHFYFIPFGVDFLPSLLHSNNDALRKPYMAFGIGLSPQLFRRRM